MAKITDYPSITTIDANTILLADGSSGTGKILASDMAKYALETYAGSTLAGEAQSVKAALTGLAPQVKASITDLATISPGEQGYFQLNASVSPIGATAYFTVWCTGNDDRRGIIAILTAESKTRFFANAGHASSGVFAWKGWKEISSKDNLAITDRFYLGPDDVSIPTNSDFNDYKTAGTYVVNAGSQMATMANAPVSDIGGRLDVKYILKTNAADADSAKRLFQIFTGNNSSYPQWIRFFNGSSWFPWQKMPTRAEVDALSTNIEGTFTPDSSLTNLGENGVKVWQSGKVVTVSGYLQASFPGTTNIQVGAISGVGVPQNPIRARGGCGPNAYTTGNDAYVAITRDGKVTAYSAGAGTSLYFTIAYITA